MRKVGIIAEYNPFHRGHARHLLEAKKRSGAEAAVVVMSGCFVQRGAPALISPDVRVAAALRAGADAVFCLPALWAVREAEHFAAAGVHLLASLGCEVISFGAETADVGRLQRAARLLEEDDLQGLLREALQAGLPYPEAVSRAAERLEPGTGALLSAPNNILAISYLRAIKRQGVHLEPLPIERRGDYHAPELQQMPSAAAVRSAILRGDWVGAEAAMPEGDWLRGTPLHRPEALETALLARLRTMTEAEWHNLPGLSEGIEERLRTAAQRAVSREELLQLAKTRRYPYARLERLCCQALLGMTAADTQAPLPETAWLLGFRRASEKLIGELAGSFPVETSFQRLPDSAWKRLEERAWALWALGAGLPGEGIYRRKTLVAPLDTM